MINTVIIAGNLTRDVEIKFIPSGKAVGQATIAVSRKWKNEQGEKMEKTSFVEVEIWGKTAETLAEYVKKGQPVLFEGELTQDTWDDKESGQKRSKLKVNAQRWHFMASKKGESQGQGKHQLANRNTDDKALDIDLDGEEIPF